MGCLATVQEGPCTDTIPLPGDRRWREPPRHQDRMSNAVIDRGSCHQGFGQINSTDQTENNGTEVDVPTVPVKMSQRQCIEERC